MRLLVFFMFCIVCSSVFAKSSAMPHEVLQKEPLIRIAFHPQITGDQDILKELFVEELKKITHLNIKAYMPKTYSEVVEMMKNKKLDFAFLSGRFKWNSVKCGNSSATPGIPLLMDNPRAESP